MKRPLAYITAAWLGGDSENAELAAQYCRTVYEAGFSPICPPLYLPLFLNDAVPEEHKSGIDMSRDLLRRCPIHSVCICCMVFFNTVSLLYRPYFYDWMAGNFYCHTDLDFRMGDFAVEKYNLLIKGRCD